MTDGRWILDGLLGSAMRRMPGMSSVRGRPALSGAPEAPDRASPDERDPKLRATTETIVAMPVDERLRQLEAESDFFSSVRPLDV